MIYKGKNKITLVILIMALLLFLEFYCQPVKVQAADEYRPKILLVYDSVNQAAKGDLQIQALQRTLTSLGQSSKTISMAKYHAGELTKEHYQAVITLINWSQKTSVASNASYWQDLKDYTGYQLHIGPNLHKFEEESFTGTFTDVVHQQFELEETDKSATQLLTMADEWRLFTPNGDAGPTEVGQLLTQDDHKVTYPYGIIQGKKAYLPFYQEDGLTYLTAAKVIAQWLALAKNTQAPLLTITNVTPMSDFKQLATLARYLSRNNQPFAVSATSIHMNTDLPEFKRYMNCLRVIIQNGGLIYLQVPYVYTSLPNQTATLTKVMKQQLKALVKFNIFPVGISAPSYWNQDKVFQTAGLSYADHIMLLPNPETISYQDYRATSVTYTQAISAITYNSLARIRKNGTVSLQNLTFATPTAITFDAPTSETELAILKTKINKLTMPLADSAEDGWHSKLIFGKHQLLYQQGNYYYDHDYQTLIAPEEVNRVKNKTKYRGNLSGFFQFQNTTLVFFLSAVLVVLIVLLFVGRRVYLNKFKRH